MPIDLTTEILKDDILYPTHGMKLTCDHRRREYVLLNNFHAYDHYDHSHWDKTVEYLKHHQFRWILYEYEPTPHHTTSIGFANNNGSFLNINRGSCFYISWPMKNEKNTKSALKRPKMG